MPVFRVSKSLVNLRKICLIWKNTYTEHITFQITGIFSASLLLIQPCLNFLLSLYSSIKLHESISCKHPNFPSMTTLCLVKTVLLARYAWVVAFAIWVSASVLISLKVTTCGVWAHVMIYFVCYSMTMFAASFLHVLHVLLTSISFSNLVHFRRNRSFFISGGSL